MQNSDGSYTYDISLSQTIRSNGISALYLFLDPSTSVSGTRSMTILDIGFRKNGEAAYDPSGTTTPTNYKLTISSMKNGAVKANKSTAISGETVNLTITPDKNYILADGSLKYNGIAIAGNSFTMPAADVTITASFERTYTLSYNANEGKNAPASQTGSTVTVSGPGSMSNSNKTFVGWNTQANGKGTSYQPEAMIKLSANTMLYAQWTTA